ncbi:MAG: type I-C CRISPR-associated endonuclease Cas1c [Victivallaceae bacterium]|nr:type I-C CRISPR-associated endonuclease Cas1c [Victivallaceae bacterium]MDD4180274.1 type I-C CRISPR-associated endonuclease Cas1c [Victivallaceae bacterium]
MKKMLNTLYVSTQGLYLSKEGETLVATLKGKKISQIPLLNLSGIVCLGNVLCSPFLLGECATRHIQMSFLTANGRFLARVQGKISGNVMLRREQYRIADSSERSSLIVRSFIIAKILNSRTVLQRFRRDHPENANSEKIDEHLRYLKSQTNLLRSASDRNAIGIDSMRGVEGEAGLRYFSLFNDLITAQKDDFVFNGRNRRPPLDPVNALLSFCYTLLMHDIVGALETVGLDPTVGFLHYDRSGRASLALDMMEEFRHYFADRLVLSLINLRKINAKGFKISASGAVVMNDDTRKIVINSWQERKQDEVLHPYLKEKIKLGMLPFAQAMLMARHIRGDINAYPPFITR